MKNSSTIFIILFPIFLNGQSVSSFNFVIGSSYDYRILHVDNDNKQDALYEGIIESRAFEIGSVGLRLGIDYNRKISYNYFFKTGIRLVKTGYKSALYDLSSTGQWGSQHTGSGRFDPSQPGEPVTKGGVRFFYDYIFFEMPLVMRYEFNSLNKFAWFAELGLAPKLLVTSKYKFGQSSAPISANKFHLNSNISAGFNYASTDKHELFLQAILRYQLSKIVDAPIHEHLMSIGLEAGVRRKF